MLPHSAGREARPAPASRGALGVSDDLDQHLPGTLGRAPAEPDAEQPAISRRRFLKIGASGAGAAVALGALDDAAAAAAGDFSFAILTDVHYAARARRGSRYYSDSLAKMRRCVETLNKRRPAFAVALGDTIDKAKDKATELGYLRAISAEFAKFRGERHYVIGNHDVATLSKKEFIAGCSAPADTVAKAARPGRRGAGSSYHSFDSGRYHFVVLDGNFRKDGTAYDAGNFNWTDTYIHAPQREWLRRDLAKARGRKTIVFIHQNLHDEKNAHGVKNAPETRSVLERAGNVLAVIQGHDHAGGCTKIEGIHYFTLKAMVEGPGLANNAYALVHLDARDRIRVEGFGRQKDRAFE
jgi:alkaline phosphatase